MEIMMRSKRILALVAFLTVILLQGCPEQVSPQSKDYTGTGVGTLKYVPAGTFFNGTANMTVSEFRMSQYEVTRAQFLAVMGTDPSDTFYSSGTSDPVQNVNWYHAIAFCNKLSLAEGLARVYDVTGLADDAAWRNLAYASIPTVTNAEWNAATATWRNNGYRLPTEMEWMWAAMGAPGDGQNGGINSTGYTKAFAGSTGSNLVEDYAVFGYGSGATGATTTPRSSPVGSKTSGANELGLYDISGNVWEWCWDWLTSYPGAVTDYHGPALGADRVIRGGCWIFDASLCSIAGRAEYDPSYRRYDSGFRVVRN
jgi:formylglycine-generating enzyme required for sulfatase activity